MSDSDRISEHSNSPRAARPACNCTGGSGNHSDHKPGACRWDANRMTGLCRYCARNCVTVDDLADHVARIKTANPEAA